MTELRSAVEYMHKIAYWLIYALFQGIIIDRIVCLLRLSPTVGQCLQALFQVKERGGIVCLQHGDGHLKTIADRVVLDARGLDARAAHVGLVKGGLGRGMAPEQQSG